MTEAQQLVKSLLEGESARDFLRRHSPTKKKLAPNQEVSHGTLNPQHLLRRFLETLHDLDPAGYEKFVAKACYDANVDAISDLFTTDEWTEEGDWILDRLSDLLDSEYCPPGFGFGSHVGDSSSFGCWSGAYGGWPAEE